MRVVAWVLALVVLGGCSIGNDTGGAVGEGPTTSAPPVQIALAVDVTGGPQPVHGSITCRGNEAIGTGHLLGPRVAAAACAVLLRDPTVAAGLGASGPPSTGCGTAVTGPEQAHLVGTFKGTPVDRTIDRSDPCDAPLYDALAVVLGTA